MKPSNFWNKHPSLLYGLSLLLGTLFVLCSPLALIPLLFLLDKKHVVVATLLFLLPLAFLYHVYTFPPSNTVVSGVFHIQSLRDGKSFLKGWSYRGVLKTKEGKIHCQMHSKVYYQANRSYRITGRASSRNGLFYSIKPFEWKPVENSFSLAEERYHAKKWVKAYIERHISQSRAAHFLSGMVTGELEDQMLCQEFGNLGLSHIMAISGFHFALLTLFFHLLLRLFLPQKIEAILLIALLTLYLLFIGNSPSIQRAWIVAMVFLLGQILERPISPLNSLGLALCIAVLSNPLSSATLSFQLSFLATAGILLLYSPLNQLLQTWIPKLPLSDVIERPFLWQHIYVAGNMLREALALTGAVHLVLVPYLLYVFHTFSLNSLIYNLFFPFCASIALFLFLLGILTGGLLHPLNGWYCEKLLTLTEAPPILFKPFYIEGIPSWMVVIYTTILFVGLIVYHEHRENSRTLF